MRLLRSLLAFCVFACACTSTPLAPPSPAGPGSARAHGESFFAYPWVWTDERGDRVTLSRWRGDPLVLTAFFTACRSACPRTIGKLRQMDQALRRQGAAPQFLLVTLDPATDTPERLRHFKESEGLPDSWHLLTGSAAQTDELTELLAIHVLRADAHTVHNARIVVLDARGFETRSFSGFALDEDATAL